MLAGVARLNKLYLAFLKAVREGLPGEWAYEEERFRRYIGSSLEVANALRGLRYGFYKFRRPVDHVSVDLDLLIHVDDIGEAIWRLTSRGFRITVSEPYTVTLERGGFIVDLYTHPSFAWIVYMDGLRILRDYSEEFEVAGTYVPGITREAEVAVAVAHAVYKEHMVLLIDCLTAWSRLTGRTARVAEELGAGRALEKLLNTCREIRVGASEAPYRIPAPSLIGIYLEKAIADRVFRATALNIPEYILRRGDSGIMLTKAALVFDTLYN